MPVRILEYSIGISGFLAALAIGHSYASQFHSGPVQGGLFW